jgi:hypothetical protein
MTLRDAVRHRPKIDKLIQQRRYVRYLRAVT